MIEMPGCGSLHDMRPTAHSPTFQKYYDVLLGYITPYICITIKLLGDLVHALAVSIEMVNIVAAVTLVLSALGSTSCSQPDWLDEPCLPGMSRRII